MGFILPSRIFSIQPLEKYRRSEEDVDTLFGCIGGLMPVSTLVESKKPIRIDRDYPEHSLNAHIETNTRELLAWNNRKKKRKGDKEPEGYQLDILNGGYAVSFRSAGERCQRRRG